VSMPPSPPAAPNPVFQFFSSAAASASSAMEDAVAQVSGAAPGKAIDTEPELAFVPEPEEEEDRVEPAVEAVNPLKVSMPPSPPAAPNPVFQFFSSAAASASSAMEDAVAQVSGAVPGKAIDTEPELAFVPEPEEEEDRFEPAVEAVNPFKEVAAMADELPPVPPPPPPPLTADNPVAQFFTSAAASASDAVSSAVNDAVAQVKESVDVAVIEAQALPGQLVQSAKEQADEVLTKVAAIPQEAADRAASSTLDYVADARSKVEIARQKRDAMKGQ